MIERVLTGSVYPHPSTPLLAYVNGCFVRLCRRMQLTENCTLIYDFSEQKEPL